MNLYYIYIILALLWTILSDIVKNIVKYASCLHVTYIANNIRIIIILFFGRFHLQMNKTSVTTLYLYAFLFTLSAWLCDVTFTADRSCTLVGCDTVSRVRGRGANCRVLCTDPIASGSAICVLNIFSNHWALMASYNKYPAIWSSWLTTGVS